LVDRRRGERQVGDACLAQERTRQGGNVLEMVTQRRYDDGAGEEVEELGVELAGVLAPIGEDREGDPGCAGDCAVRHGLQKFCEAVDRFCPQEVGVADDQI